ncbi:hypothetical protein HMPREF3196_01244 [Bifidobacterium bifidum]|uniref:Uncharacterized protein n=1 Tax=Bifidobacterium bifidum TaxID=1681 RepID=A0A133KN17_BIFBI|nr:hypothetical protein BIFBIF_01675 [Bifidobacterium bifidum ATCC 29521 = JCM 1255 = DSM 20456]KWZ81099.1 hypothetical protein HMPREF3196_01244 [Bifidobacterium bifidum]
MWSLYVVFRWDDADFGRWWIFGVGVKCGDSHMSGLRADL